MAGGFVSTDNDALTEKIIGAAYSVANILGFGFLEKVYENALAVGLLINFGSSRIEIKRVLNSKK